mmetsp:Transcript_35025/g.78932  ORF Transcript_35025/g.78932 Transcript_35025/m.78932 type:complete len:87 (-) Transcript_35025:53-313(-)
MSSSERRKVSAQKVFGVTMNKGCVAKIKDEERFSNWAWLPTLTVCYQYQGVNTFTTSLLALIVSLPSLGSNQPYLLNQAYTFLSCC